MPKNLATDDGSVRTILRDPAIDVFGWKNVVILVWRGDATPELLIKLAALIEARWRGVGQMACVNVVQKMFSLPTDEQRQAFKKVAAKMSGRYSSMVIVLEGEGFLFSAARGLVTGLFVVTRQQFDVRIVGNLDEVVHWLPDKHEAATGVTLDPSELKAALTTACA